MYGAIDLGGTKIEACLFDKHLVPVVKKRVATPRESYDALLDSIAQQCHWLMQAANVTTLNVGIGIPGLVDRHTGLSWTANLAATGRPLQGDLERRLGFPIAVENDCKCFALSEACGGAGDGFPVVFGLIIGTGVGGGICRNGELLLHHGGIAGEVGHFGLPAELVERFKLPLLQCGCGRVGCYETLVSGPGMSKLCQHLTGGSLAPQSIVAGAGGGDVSLTAVFDCWLTLLGELIHTIQLVIDPDCIVLGGGLSLIEDLPERLSLRMARHQLPGTSAPVIRRAQFGDSSGVRGAAILAQMASFGGN